jgi:hypothetical protein
VKTVMSSLFDRKIRHNNKKKLITIKR